MVDHEATVIEVLRTFLQSLGYETATAENAIEALKIIGERGEFIDLVITDTAMPEMHGIDLMQSIIEFHPLCRS